ncbi:MAG: hypothetical protein OXG58_09305 [Gemmatimonadetes bacterium]|nr:hypothetical protein [Gemmatimonadota bacterium]MCY3944062.1 hypothetical protein [Gemmatimonadota bacterium]
MNWHRAGVGLGALVVSVGLTACDLLRVKDPGRYEEEDLLTALEAVGNTAEGNAHKWMNWYVIWQELLGDALNFIGPITYNDEYALIDDGRVDFNTYPVARTPANSRYVAYNFPDGMAESRWLAHKAWEIAELAYEKGDSMEAELDFESSFLAAQIKLGWAFNNMYLGLFSCEGVLGSPDDEGGAEMYLDVQIYDSAASLFTHVIEIMGRVDPFLIEFQDRDYLNAARTGRALMRMLAGDYEGAVADAATVPDGFRYDAILGGSFENWNQMYWRGFQFRYFRLHDWVIPDTLGPTFSGSLPDRWTGLPDRRRQVQYLPKPFFGDRPETILPTKYGGSTSGISMVSAIHARLIEAEAMAMSGNFLGAMTVLDAMRVEVNLPAIPFTPENEVQMLDVLLWERYAWLFVEGWRQPDLHRSGLTRAVFEALNDYDRRGIGRPTKFPGSAREAWLNPLVVNDATQRCHPNA